MAFQQITKVFVILVDIISTMPSGHGAQKEDNNHKITQYHWVYANKNTSKWFMGQKRIETELKLKIT